MTVGETGGNGEDEEMAAAASVRVCCNSCSGGGGGVVAAAVAASAAFLARGDLFGDLVVVAARPRLASGGVDGGAESVEPTDCTSTDANKFGSSSDGTTTLTGTPERVVVALERVMRFGASADGDAADCVDEGATECFVVTDRRNASFSTRASSAESTAPAV